jgi:ABC-type uncharacterized transport system substrate-binding protein
MDDSAVLEELKNILEKMGVKICEQKLEAENEKAQSAMVRINQQKMFFLEKKLKTQDQIQILIQAIKKMDLAGIYITPYVRSMIEADNEKNT